MIFTEREIEILEIIYHTQLTVEPKVKIVSSKLDEVEGVLETS